MKQVYSPANAPEAHMLKHQLEQAGIAAHVLGEALQGAAGELPAGNLIQLMVADEDFERARELVLAWERTTMPSDPVAAPGRRFRFVAALVFLSVGIVAGWSLKVAMDNSRFSVGDSRASLDRNGDGRDDVTWFYRLGSQIVHKAEYDSNFDGHVDMISHFDEVGTTTSEEWDGDYDGVFDGRGAYRAGVLSETESDTDGNGVPDVHSSYEDGLLKRQEVSDSRYGQVVRIDHFSPFQLERAEIDLDRDGFLETVRTFDRFGEIVSTETRRSSAR